jgi:hypothetical protein
MSPPLKLRTPGTTEALKGKATIYRNTNGQSAIDYSMGLCVLGEFDLLNLL